MRRKQGGSLFHPYLAADTPNFIQTLDNKWNGSLDPVPKPASPVDYSWKWQTGANAMRQISYASLMRPTTVGGRRKTRRATKRRGKSYRRK